MKAKSESKCMDVNVYATSISKTERSFSVPLKLAAQDFDFVAGVDYAVTVSVVVDHVSYTLDASICGAGSRPDLNLETYTWTCVPDNGAIISATLEPDGKTLLMTSPASGSLRDYWFDGAYQLTIPHEQEVNEIVIGTCCIKPLI